VATHLQEAPVVGPFAAHEDRFHRGLHVVVDAARAGTLEKRKRAVMRVEHHLLRLARIGADEQHPAMAQPHVRHLHRHRRAVDQHDFMTPVELIGLAGRETQRNEGTDRARRAVALPDPGIAPHGIVAAFVTETAECLENPDQRQPFAARLGLIRRQQLIQRVLPRPNPRQRLLTAFVMKFRRLRPQNLSHDLPRNSQFAADRLDRLLLNEIRAADLRDRLQNQHPAPGSRAPRKPS
jgi:hypothetical protein